jgi:hypothetical protein
MLRGLSWRGRLPFGCLALGLFALGGLVFVDLLGARFVCRLLLSALVACNALGGGVRLPRQIGPATVGRSWRVFSFAPSVGLLSHI